MTTRRHFEIIVPHRDAPDEIIIACEPCTAIFLARSGPSASAAPEPLADYCMLHYEEVCQHDA